MNDAWKILLIDDDPGIRKVMAITLEDAGYRVVTAPDGETGLSLLPEENPQVVITDVRMPGIDGIEVLKSIKNQHEETEVIVMTAFSDLELAIQALHLDASDFITKPIHDEALTVALRRAKERYTTRKELSDYTSLIEERWMCTADQLSKTFHLQQMLIESSIDGIVATDGEGKIVIFNRSMEDTLEYQKTEVIRQMNLTNLFSPREAEKFCATLFGDEFGGKNRLFLYECTLLAKSGVKVPVQVSAVVLFEEGENVGVVAFFRDLTNIRKLTQEFADQARMLQQDKMVSLGRLAASVVHEINNPLAGILNYARLMSKILNRGPLNPESTQKFQGYLGLMETELSRCSKIVSNLLAFSRKSKLEFGEVNLNELISKSILLSEHRLTLQNIQIETTLPGEIPKVLGDFNQLQQCLINLIFNAIDAMPEGGTLSLGCTIDRKNRLIEMLIHDTGHGIAKEDQLYIFDPFFTTKTESKGLGLGLSTVFGIIDKHKGTITVDSQPGQGATFSIKLPMLNS
jgi:two-component system, NtrC family, sensor kinase